MPTVVAESVDRLVTLLAGKATETRLLIGRSTLAVKVIQGIAP
jgi:hypothetical protein